MLGRNDAPHPVSQVGPLVRDLCPCRWAVRPHWGDFRPLSGWWRSALLGACSQARKPSWTCLSRSPGHTWSAWPGAEDLMVPLAAPTPMGTRPPSGLGRSARPARPRSWCGSGLWSHPSTTTSPCCRSGGKRPARPGACSRSWTLTSPCCPRAARPSWCWPVLPGAAGRLRGRAGQDRPAPCGRRNDRFAAPQGRPRAHR